MNRNDERKYFKRNYGLIPAKLLKPFSFETNGNTELAIRARDDVEANRLQNETEKVNGDNKDMDSINQNMKTLNLT